MSRRAMPAIDAYVQRVTESGLICSGCGAEFTEPHGWEVYCGYCWDKLSPEEQGRFERATHPEKNKEAHKTLARARRAAKESKNNG